MKILSNYEFCYFINFAESGIIALKIILPGGYQRKNTGWEREKTEIAGDIA
jgi:hypothetical protein